MAYSVISKALVIGTLMVSAYASIAVADEASHAPKAEAQDENAVITVEQQREMAVTVLSWQRNITNTLQKDRENMMLLRNNIDYQQHSGEFVVDSSVFPRHIVHN